MSDYNQQEESANMMLVAIIALAVFVLGMLYAATNGVTIAK